MGRNGAKALGAVRILGGATTVLGPVITGVDMYNKTNDGDPTTNINGRDVADFTVGATGVAGTGLAAFGVVSNPAGWAIGIATGVYGVATFFYDNRVEIRQGMEARQNYIDQGLMPLR